MSRRTLPVAAAALLTVGLGVAPALTTSASAAPVHGDQRVCAAPTKAGVAACDAHVRTVIGKDGKARPDATSGPTGFSSTTLQQVYGVSGLTGTTTVAVVDAYAHPNAFSDLSTYRATMGLPPLTNGTTFQQYNQSGQTAPLASGDTGWGQEEMLDLEMVSSICPTCTIVYIGANSTSFTDLGTAVQTAVSKGAKVVSNSYGAAEFSGEQTYASYYNQPGVAITVSSGDNGYGVQVPAAYNTVTAVGGTHLTVTSSGTRSSETVWSGAGSGCSALITRNSWEPSQLCSRRTVADVAAVADPQTGVSVYDTYGSAAGTPWYVFGGTSVAAPIIAGMYGQAGASSWSGVLPASLAYSHAGSLYDVTSGSNTRRCRSGYLCQAAVGYDGPTGMGTPNGTGAF